MNPYKSGRFALVIGAVLAAAAAANPAADAHKAARLDLADHALRMLEEGNDRFASGRCTHPNTDVFRINDTGSNGQHPFAAVVTCADSRVPVERLFDRGVGDLFVVRVAGNICDANEAGSVEYACEHLGTQLVVVMGHEKCGAVKAAIAGTDAGKNINSLLDNITPAVLSVKASHPDLSPDDLTDAVVHENVWQSIEDMLTSSTPMREMVARGSVTVVGAVYDVQSGRVEWMGPHPMQTALLRRVEPTSPAAPPAPVAAADDKPAPEAARPEPKPAAAKDKSQADNRTGFVKPSSAPRKEAESKVEGQGQKPEPAQAAHPH
jgi:carbonic anhydrase